MIDFQSPRALTDTAPLRVIQPRADFGDGDEEIAFGIIQPYQQGTRTEGCAFATSVEIPQQDAVNGVAQGSS